MDAITPYIEELTWTSARADIMAVDPELAKIIDAWNPPSDFGFVKVRYPYGHPIVKGGVLHIPTANGLPCPINSGRIPTKIQTELSYSNLPLGVICKNGSEVFLEDEDRVIPLAFFTPGVILGLWEALEPKPSHFPKRIWEVSAGARSLFLLPKVSQTGLHEKLKKKYGVRSPAPKTLFSHSVIFNEIINHPGFEHEWSNDIIFFNQKWLERNTDNPHWLRFHHYLLERAWELSGYNRNTTTYDRIWQLFARHLSEKSIKPNAYLIDTLKHLIAIGSGVVPGFKPACNTEIPGPVNEIQEIYLKDYELKQYIPTMMMPFHFSRSDNQHYVYYSLQMPTLFDSLPKSRNQQSVLVELRELKQLVNHFFIAALDGKLKIEDSPVEWLVNNIDFEFFHSDSDPYGEIKSSKQMPIDDKELIYLPGKMRGRQFAYNSTFVRGCVRMSRIRH